MITIITSRENDLKAGFDLRFGRAEWFCVFDEESKSTQFVNNEFKDANSGAGLKAAEKAYELGAGKVISGDFGPKAKDILEKFNIQMVILQDENNTIEDIINKIKTD